VFPRCAPLANISFYPLKLFFLVFARSLFDLAYNCKQLIPRDTLPALSSAEVTGRERFAPCVSLRRRLRTWSRPFTCFRFLSFRVSRTTFCPENPIHRVCRLNLLALTGGFFQRWQFVFFRPLMSLHPWSRWLLGNRFSLFMRAMHLAPPTDLSRTRTHHTSSREHPTPRSRVFTVDRWFFQAYLRRWPFLPVFPPSRSALLREFSKGNTIEVASSSIQDTVLPFFSAPYPPFAPSFTRKVGFRVDSSLRSPIRPRPIFFF